MLKIGPFLHSIANSYEDSVEAVLYWARKETILESSSQMPVSKLSACSGVLNFDE